MIPREVIRAIDSYGACDFADRSNRYDALIAAIERAIDAKPAAEFVTTAMHDALKTDRDNWQQGASGWFNVAQRLQKRAEAAEAERDRLATALAAAQARVVTLERGLAEIAAWDIPWPERREGYAVKCLQTARALIPEGK